jgi:hypothetical protein
VAQWCPLRANPGVDATIQATANAAAKRNFMILVPVPRRLRFLVSI